MTAYVGAAWLAALLGLVAVEPALAQEAVSPGSGRGDSLAVRRDSSETGLRDVIHRHLGRPYVWGACGLKSFDCSGFVWRVMHDNGIFIKRTTARKYYMTLPKASEQNRWAFGNVVFFEHLKHCGIVDSRETFYHAGVIAGTSLSRFDPLWRRKISGVRAMPH